MLNPNQTLEPTPVRSQVILAVLYNNIFETCTGAVGIGPGCGKRLHISKLNTLSDDEFICDVCAHTPNAAAKLV